MKKIQNLSDWELILLVFTVFFSSISFYLFYLGKIKIVSTYPIFSLTSLFLFLLKHYIRKKSYSYKKMKLLEAEISEAFQKGEIRFLKSLIEIQNEVAKEYGEDNFEVLIKSEIYAGDVETANKIFNEVAKRFISQHK